MYSGWPVERQTMFTAWPDTYKTYYWTLTPAQQSGWWVLTDDQRSRVYAMTPEQRTAAWAAISSQMANMPANGNMAASGGAMAPSTMSSPTAQYVTGEVVQSTGAAARTGEYPLCSATVTDSCINPREAGKNYGNVPLKYWPGKPASEIPGKKPQM
jgi:hypothetical protein